MNSCDYSHDTTSEIRRLPTSVPDENGSTSAVAVCKFHYHKEMAWRRERNKELEKSAWFPFPAWSSLEIVEKAQE